MSVNWTDKQQNVIDTREKNLLVSAAAGSGKTAVLVERIIQMITDGEKPIDIDRLLVVTFTNAAAAQMRERILEAIHNKIELEPENEHLQKQQTFIHNASITTIHSFCLKVIREHFNEIDIDPGFRVGDEGELTLLKSDSISELLEEYYESDNEEFLDFIETYASGKGDDNIEELIVNLYNFSMSYPWPKKWLDYCESNYLINDKEIDSLAWLVHLSQYINMLIIDYKNSINSAINICMSIDGPYMYKEALLDDLSLLESVSNASEFDQRVEIFSTLKFSTLSRKRDESISDNKREEVKAIRQKVKDGLKSLNTNYYFQTKEEMLASIKNSAPPTRMLLELVKEFYEKFTKAKREKNIVDFNDIEHLAFQILVGLDGEGNTYQTHVAKELAQNFEEIIIDEYQDSNLLQELILKSVSREQFNTPNIFMVGDVKQSIYKFRMAKPELFVEKYNSYSLENTSLYQRINLDKNFRSRDNVLKCINFIFKQIMAKHLGDIDYDEENALYTGAEYIEYPGLNFGDTELLLVDTMKEDSKELEAQVVANRIKELVDINNGQLVVDRKTGEFRRAKYSDIVILYRSLAGQAQIVEETLMAEGIPCYVEAKEGYFSALEIRIILSLLSIIDNPMQDIELAAVLKSPIVGLDSMDLAQIKIENPTESFYYASKCYASNGKDKQLQVKLVEFFRNLEKYREMASYLSIYELLTFVLNDTGYYLYVSAMPSGDRRKANIDMLKEKAVAYESSSYKGVFNFIRYIEKLRKYKVDFAQASIISENDNTVRIMSIHKSKGLEFPIVIVGGLGKKYNNQDVNGKIVLHSEYGIGVDYIDNVLRVKEQTLIKKAIALKLKLENLAEELRVLYVALTRAKEKLILVGSSKNMEKQIGKWMSERYLISTNLAFETLASSSSFLDLIGFALIRHCSFATIFKKMNIPVNFSHPLYDEQAGFMVKWINAEEIVYDKVKDTVQRDGLRQVLLNWDSTIIYDDKIKKELENRLSYVYPYISNQDIYTKMSVSEIKKLSQTIDAEYETKLVGESAIDEPIPMFYRENAEVAATSKGSVYHKVLELIDFTKEFTLPAMETFILELTQKGLITEKTATVIEPSRLHTLVNTTLGRRIKVASINKKLFREQQYVMGVSASDINEKYAKEEIVLIQGIIDAFFEEEDGLVIVDYKTDKVHNISQLSQRYKVQLDYYGRALEQLTGKKVKEKIIYSLYLGKEVIVK